MAPRQSKSKPSVKKDTSVPAAEQEVKQLDTPVPEAVAEANVVTEEVMSEQVAGKEESVVIEDSVSTCDEIATFLTKPGVSIVDKLEHLVTSGGNTVAPEILVLHDFAKDYAANAPEADPLRVARAHYTMYNTLLAVIREEDAGLFKLKLDLVCLYFMAHCDVGGAYTPIRMMRYDYEWAWGVAGLETYHALVMVLASLSDRTKRAAELERIDLNSALIRDKLELTQDEIDRLIKYFNA